MCLGDLCLSGSCNGGKGCKTYGSSQNYMNQSYQISQNNYGGMKY
jgi:hypothetical protein